MVEIIHWWWFLFTQNCVYDHLTKHYCEMDYVDFFFQK